MIGALLRIPYEDVQQRMLARLHEGGFDDLYAAHLNVFRYPGPQGARPSALAANRSALERVKDPKKKEKIVGVMMTQTSNLADRGDIRNAFEDTVMQALTGSASVLGTN